MPDEALDAARQKGEGWMQDCRGGMFYPLAADIQAVNLHVIAHALAHQCRFGGHTMSFYSVAEHCLRAADLAVILGHPELELECLMHDASEAYLQDVPRPFKHTPGMEIYREAEERWHKVIAEKFELAYPYPPFVKRVDEIMLHIEGRDLMAPGPWQDNVAWFDWESIQDVRMQITAGMLPGDALSAWLRRALFLLVQRRSTHNATV